MQARFVKLALFAATTLASLGAYASPYDGCTTIAQGIIHCWSQSEVSRDEVKADLHEAQAAGDLKVVGELSGAPATAPAEPVTVVTRAQVREELREAQRAGDVQFGDLGRTEAEVNPQRYAAARQSHDTTAVAKAH